MMNRPWPISLVAMGFVLLWLFLAAFPYIWTAWGSFKVEADFFSRESWENALFGFKTID
jgi:trehalose/maltose transport system permease protein